MTSRFTAPYERANNGTRVRIATGDDSLVVRLVGEPSWVVVTGNVPLEIGGGISHPSVGAPLTLAELLFNLYDQRADARIRVPYRAQSPAIRANVVLIAVCVANELAFDSAGGTSPFITSLLGSRIGSENSDA